MQRIVPNLWFDHNAAEAVDLYISAFPQGRLTSTQYYPEEGLPDWQASYAGLPLVVDFEVGGYRFTGINAGDNYRPNPSISFFVNFDPSFDSDAKQHLDEAWAKLAEGGTIHMPLQAYPYSPHYGWVEDRFGVNWQLMLTNPDGEDRPFIIPCLTFGPDAAGDALAAMRYYSDVFTAREGNMVPYPPEAGAMAGKVMFGDVQLEGQWFAAMDAADFDAAFTCGVSLMVHCADQAEIDRLWGRLSAVPEAEQCGWCADQFGVSWQIVPENLGDLMGAPNAIEKLYSMKKIVIANFT